MHIVIVIILSTITITKILKVIVQSITITKTQAKSYRSTTMYNKNNN